MRSYFTLFALVLLGLIGLSLQATTMSIEHMRIARTCKPYEKFTGECESRCQPHCPKYHEDGQLIEQALFCVQSCEYMCVCKDGLVQDEQQGGECVAKDKCLPPAPLKKKSDA